MNKTGIDISYKLAHNLGTFALIQVKRRPYKQLRRKKCNSTLESTLSGEVQVQHFLASVKDFKTKKKEF